MTQIALISFIRTIGLCIEFDLYLKRKDIDNKTQKLIDRLVQVGYKVLKNDNFNITFMLNIKK